jgi:hypothetical protein
VIFRLLRRLPPVSYKPSGSQIVRYESSIIKDVIGRGGYADDLIGLFNHAPSWMQIDVIREFELRYKSSMFMPNERLVCSPLLPKGECPTYGNTWEGNSYSYHR